MAEPPAVPNDLLGAIRAETPTAKRPPAGEDLAVQRIPCDRIRVMNPRVRNRKRFQQIVENIARVGLKKPITVSRAEPDADGRPWYDLVCGQGRLEAYRALGEPEIPALVVDATAEERWIMSLVENLARRQPTTFEHVRQIVRLKEMGYSPADIAAKVDLTTSYVNSILKLWAQGEERLIRAVEKGTIPVSIAISLVNASDEETQRLLTDAYESKKLRGTRLLAAKRLIEERRAQGKSLRPIGGKRGAQPTSDDLVRRYEREVERQRIFVKKARLCESRLLFTVSAMRQLLADEHFVTLLRAEQLDTLPKPLADQLPARDGG